MAIEVVVYCDFKLKIRIEHMKYIVFLKIMSLLAITLMSNVAKADSYHLPGNHCRAAVEAQDGGFRIFNDRYKNRSATNLFIVCPVPINSSLMGGSESINLVFLNESSAPKNFNCTWYGYEIFGGSTHIAGSAADLQVTNNVAIAPFGTGTLNLTLNTVNFVQPSFLTNSNVVCLMPVGTSLVNLNMFSNF